MEAAPNPDTQNPETQNPDAQVSETGLAARRAALAVFTAGLERRNGFDAGLALPVFTRLSPRERAWAWGLAATTFRRLGPIDRALETKLQRPPPDSVMRLLRIGAAQILFRDTPAFAAVSTSVDLARDRPRSTALTREA